SENRIRPDPVLYSESGWPLGVMKILPRVRTNLRWASDCFDRRNPGNLRCVYEEIENVVCHVPHHFTFYDCDRGNPNQSCNPTDNGCDSRGDSTFKNASAL